MGVSLDFNRFKNVFQEKAVLHAPPGGVATAEMVPWHSVIECVATRHVCDHHV